MRFCSSVCLVLVAFFAFFLGSISTVSAQDAAFRAYFDQYCGTVGSLEESNPPRCNPVNGPAGSVGYNRCDDTHVGGYDCCFRNEAQSFCPVEAVVPTISFSCGATGFNSDNERHQCSCTGAPATTGCCGWKNSNDTGTHCLAAAPTVFACGQTGYSPDKSNHKCSCTGTTGTLGCCGYILDNGVCSATQTSACAAPNQCVSGDSGFCTANGGTVATGACSTGSVCCNFPDEPDPLKCGDRNTNNQCGARGGCPNGQACSNIFGLAAGCSQKEFCQDRSETLFGPYCGDDGTFNTIGGSSGCKPGYRCYRTHSPSRGSMSCVIDYSASCPTNYTCLDACTAADQCINNKKCVAEIRDGVPTISLSNNACNNTQPVTCVDPATCLVGNTRFCESNDGKIASGSCNSGSVCCDFSTKTPDPPPGGGDSPDPSDPDEESAPTLNIFAGPTSGDFKALNPLALGGSIFVDDFSSPAGIINRLLLFLFPLAGLILFVMIVWGGFEMISGATNSKSMEAGKQRITAALIGFFLLFASFWIIQIIEYIFNIAIL